MGLFGGSKSSSTSIVNQRDNKANQEVADEGTAISLSGSTISRDSTLIFENLNADLAEYTIDVAEDLFERALGFTETQFDKVMASNRFAQSEAASALNENRTFTQDLVDKVTRTEDERLNSYAKLVTIGGAGLAALLIWRMN